MGIQIKGSNDTISASDGSMVLEGSALTFDNESITGISTMATGHITGTTTLDDDLKVGVSTFFVDVSAGKVGIGTDVPGQKLHLLATSGDVYNRIDTNVNGGILIYVQGTQRSVIANDSAFSGTITDTGIGAKGNLIFRAGTSSYDERLRILSNGRIGINTSEATSALQIYAEDLGEGTAKGQIFLKDTAAYNASPTSGIVFQGHHASNNSQAIFSGIRGFKANAADGDYDGCLGFDVRTHGAVAFEAMRINEAGQVGVNTSTFNTGSKLESSSEGAYNIVARSQNGNGGYHNFTGQSSGGTNTSYITHNGRGYFEDGVQFDSSGEVLNSYEEGTWTPALTFGGGNTGISYSSRSGSFIKIGTLVYVQGQLDLVDKGSSTGNVSFTDLPFTAGDYVSGTSQEGSGFISWWANFATSNSETFFWVSQGTTTITVYRTNSGVSIANQLNSDWANNTQVRFFAQYRST